MVGFALLVILLILWVAMLPVWPYSRRWGFYPSSAAFLALILLILVIWFGFLTLRFPGGAYGAI